MTEPSSLINTENLEHSIDQPRSDIDAPGSVLDEGEPVEASQQADAASDVADDDSDRTITAPTPTLRGNVNLPELMIVNTPMPLVGDHLETESNYTYASEKLEFNKTDEFLDRAKLMALEAEIVANQSQFLSGNYEQKSDGMATKIQALLHVMLRSTPPNHLRHEFANVFNFGVTLSELWIWVCETLDVTFDAAGNKFIPCNLIDMFDDNCATLEHCMSYSHIDVCDFAQLLALRDECLLAVQQCLLITMPMYNRTDRPGQRIPPFRGDDVQYYPYDFEWMCGTIISGPCHLNATKYLASSRMTQWNINNIRVDIMATDYGVVLDDPDGLRAPLPVSVVSAKMLATALHNREQEMKAVYMKSFKALAKARPKNRQLHFSHGYWEYFMIRGEIRRKKQNLMDMIVRCDRSDIYAYLRVIGVLTTMETYLLIFLRCFAVYADKHIGMYGKVLPKKLYLILHKLYVGTNVIVCREQAVFNRLREQMEELRREVSKVVRAYYKVCEEKVDCYFREPFDVVSCRGRFRFVYNVREIDFPVEVRDQSSTMVSYLHLEQLEMERLIEQLCQVKRAKLIWPTEPGVPAFMLNTCPDKLYSFHSNFAEWMLPTEVARASEHAMVLSASSIYGHTIGTDIIFLARTLMNQANVIPARFDTRTAFLIEFFNFLGDTDVEGKGAEYLAELCVSLIYNELEMTNQTPVEFETEESKETACTVAKICVAKFVDQLKKNEDAPCPMYMPPPPEVQDEDPVEIQKENLDVPDKENEMGTADGTEVEVEQTVTIVEVTRDDGTKVYLGYPLDGGPPIELDQITAMEAVEEIESQTESSIPAERLEDAARVTLMFNAMGLQPIPTGLFFGNAPDNASEEVLEQEQTAPNVMPNYMIDAFLNRVREVNWPNVNDPTPMD